MKSLVALSTLREIPSPVKPNRKKFSSDYHKELAERFNIFLINRRSESRKADVSAKCFS